MKKKLLRPISVIMALSLLIGSTTAGAEPAVTTVVDASAVIDTSQEPQDSTGAPEVVAPYEGESSFAGMETAGSMVYLPNGLKAVMATPSVDFYKGEQTDASLASELTDMVDRVSGYGLNALLINTDHEDISYYDLEINSSERGVIGSAIDAAHERGLSAYVVLDVNRLISAVLEQGGGLKDGFSAEVHKFVMKYACEGIILTNYYTADSPEMYEEYMRCGSGIGYQNWLYETNEYVVRSIADIVRRTNNSVAVGLMINDMWANYTSHESGSVTADSVEAYFDGFSDTRKYVEKGYADLVLVKAYGSTSDGSLNFENVIDWWYDLAEANGAKAYVLHLNERIGQYSGWYEDQLLRQLTVMEDYENIGGSAFNSLASLDANPLGTTDTLLKYFAKQINTDTIFEDLVMTSPSSTSFVTYDPSVKFMGTFDENFDVYFDGEKIKLNEVGNFYFQKELNVGWNTFVIEHKGKQIKYSIERRVDVMTSIEHTDDEALRVEGGTEISLKAVAYGGSSVSASIGGQVINLKEREGSAEELGDANSSYMIYTGTYTAPAGIIGSEQYLGEIVYYANYKGYEEYITGGTVTVEAKPEPPKNDIVAEFVEDQSAVGTGEVVATMPAVVSDSEYIEYIRVINDYTMVYDAMTAGAVPSPVFCQLPAGTLDYYKSSSGGYIITTSGKRFAAEDVTMFTDTGLGNNALVIKEIGNQGGKSYIKINLRYKSSYNITAPVAYHDDLDGSYGVENYNADKVYITFDNVTSVTKLPSFDYCTLFSAGEWETVDVGGIQKFRLALTLREAGIYSGNNSYYDANGDLVIEFAVPTPSLYGKVIVIDPGHGYGKTPDKLDPGAIGNVTEQSVNLAVAKELEAQLTALGATVVRLKTESEFIITETRPTVARAYGADMFISLHCNSAANTEAKGVEVFYFTSFSQPLARAINNQLASYYENSVYGNGASCSRGDKYSYYWVTLQQDFPSVLVEMGFISNEEECMAMADPTHQKGLAAAIANGVYAYFARSTLTYSGNGSDNAPDVPAGDEPADTPDEPVETPEAPDAPLPDEDDDPVEVPEEEDDPEDEPEVPEDDPEDEPAADDVGGGIRVE